MSYKCIISIAAITGIILSLSRFQQDAVEAESRFLVPTRVLGQDYAHLECSIGDYTEHNYVARPSFKGLKAKGLGTLGDFEVTYTGFTPEAQAAFQYAVDIWDMLLDSEVKINVRANFASLNSGVLGSAAPTGYYENFSDKAEFNIEYPGPLAEKIAGFNLNRTDPDLSCNFSEDVNWYYDTANPSGIGSEQFDFATVVLHELGHGLGFLSSNTFASTDGVGFIGGVAPVVTDIFSLLLEDENENSVLLNYEEATTDLGGILTGGNLFFDSHTVPRDTLPEIFAPNPWNGGSSLSHLDEGAHAGQDALMTPSVGRSEVIHDPALSLTMMYDMGWRSSFIAHRSENRELLNQPVPIIAQIFTDDGVGFDSSSVKLIYSVDQFATPGDTVSMSSNDDSASFEASFMADGETKEYQYYIAICDTINKGLSSPRLAPADFHNILIGIDTDAPLVDHVPVEFYFLDEDPPTVETLVTDLFTGVDSVLLEYQVNNGPTEKVEMIFSEFDLYAYQLDVDATQLNSGDSILYRITAIDRAQNKNSIALPTEGFFKVEIKDIPNAVSYYFNDFNGSVQDFSNNSFSIRTEDGFEDAALHSDHPYINAGAGNELNFIARLRVPIMVVEQNGLIEYDEMVLVEPGSAGSSFGATDFWDFVIVEASKDNGATWIRMIDGYDSTDMASWESRYNVGISGQNSTSTGDQSLVIRRSIPLHQPARGINIGDEVILRWRLFSDPFAVGWGWVIDNLEIQKNTTPTIELDKFNNSILLAPNPIQNGLLKFEKIGDININAIQIFDIHGRLYHAASINDYSVDVQALPKGSYFAVFETDDILISKPFIKL